MDCKCALKPYFLKSDTQPKIVATNLNIIKNSEIILWMNEDFADMKSKKTFVLARATENLTGMPGTIRAGESTYGKQLSYHKAGNDIQVTIAPHSGTHDHSLPGWAIFLIISSIMLTLATGGYILYLKKPHLFRRFSYATIEDNPEL